ncbi:MAG: ABC transporter permease [Actinomycetota bacterium]|nr:ABC transporter permease [Actinomycetota bacterium]
MGKFLLRRLLNYLVLVSMATCLGYFLAANTLNPRQQYENRNPPPPEASVDRTLSDLNLNDKTPVVERFTTWVSGVVRGDFGKTVDGRSVNEQMRRRMGVSIRLLLIGSILGALVGVAIGVGGAVKQYRTFDHVSTASSFLVLATPVFLLAVLLKYGAVNLNQYFDSPVLYYVGEFNPALDGGWWVHLVDRIKHLILPTLSIMLGSAAFYSRYQRNSMLDVLGSDFLRTARAKGLGRRQALVKHALRTAVIPMTTFFAYSFGLLLTGATFTEKIFGWHGMGEWLVDSINKNDVNVVAAVTVFSGILVLLAGLLADVAYAALDPRVRVR